MKLLGPFQLWSVLLVCLALEFEDSLGSKRQLVLFDCGFGVNDFDWRVRVQFLHYWTHLVSRLKSQKPMVSVTWFPNEAHFSWMKHEPFISSMCSNDGASITRESIWNGGFAFQKLDHNGGWVSNMLSKWSQSLPSNWSKTFKHFSGRA